MNEMLPYHLFCASLMALGIWLLFSAIADIFSGASHGERMSGFLGSKGQRELIVSDLPPLAQRCLAAPLTDVGNLIFGRRDQTSLENRLRRSGWRYTSPADYYASSVAAAVAFLMLGIFVGLTLEFPAFFTLLLAAALGLVGLKMPAWEVERTIAERREALFHEMAWTLERVAMVMKTGEALEPTLNRITDAELAWVAGGSGGLFIALLRDIAAGMSTRRHDVAEMLDDLRCRLPDRLPELDEFLQAVQLYLEKRHSIVEQLRALGRTMRDQLNNRIDEVAQKAELKVVAITSGVIVPALLLVIGGAAIVGFLQAF